MSSPNKPNTIDSLAARVPAGRYLLFIGTMVSGCFIDLLTKQIVFHSHFDPDRTSAPDQHWWISGWLGIETSTNRGALFGIGQGKSTWFALLSIAALIGIVYWLFVRRAALDRWLTFALGAISGGILGNLYDRMGLWHAGSRAHWQGHEIGRNHQYGVRDWIHFRWEDAPLKVFDPWPNFNIADSLLVCGAIALFIHAVFAKPPNVSAPEASDDSDADSATASTPKRDSSSSRQRRSRG